MRGEVGSILSGTMSQEMRLEILSNNMANANTVGFKEDRVFRIPETPASVWNNLSADQTKDVPINNISSLPVGTFTNFEQGHLKETGNALDMALEGEGFFSVQTSQGMQYTRKGSFALSSNGTLVTQEGYPVLGKGGGQIKISGQQVVVGPSGAIVVDGVEVGALNIVEFANKTGLLKTGDSLYSPQDPKDTGAPAKKTVVQQRFIEGSNVDPVKMMTEMINVMRGYESYQKVLQSMNEVDTKTNEVGKLA
jgi:flagellar basal-body rod protein FlgG